MCHACPPSLVRTVRWLAAPKLARGGDPVRRRGEIRLQQAHAVDRIRQSVARIILPGSEVAGLTIP